MISCLFWLATIFNFNTLNDTRPYWALHVALSASPHFFMDALYRPTPVSSRFRVVQCFRLRSSSLTPSPGSDKWRCTRVGMDASHSCFHVAAIHALFDRSSQMTLQGALYRIKILCRRYTFWSYPTGKQ